jgi:putative transposase
VFILHVRLVFVTRYRHKVFGPAHLERMEEIIRDVCADFRAELAEFNGEPRACPPAGELPAHRGHLRLVNSLKGVSSRRLRQEFPDLRQHYWRARRLWSGSYFAGSAGGAPISVLRQYIEQQDRPS